MESVPSKNRAGFLEVLALGSDFDVKSVYSRSERAWLAIKGQPLYKERQGGRVYTQGTFLHIQNNKA